ncbi:PIN domain-containing protein [Candidatus Palauibacter sp.]|uniref:PIN domain-containing protein n=1 Tax=Candidatus Palauibacter sp. TaxID=3101350 RepID=UPI003AF1F400
MLNLDTHILIHAIRGELKAGEESLLARHRWSVSSIVFWEIAKLVELGRIEMDFDDREITGTLSRLHAWPIDLAVARTSTRLDFTGDPADEIIAATSVVYQIPLVTRDRVIRGSDVVPLAL